MALFNRRKQEKDALPQEVREYYQTERRERTGKAWLLAVLTLLATFLLAAALFFGGRWLYRAVFDNDNDNSTSQVEEIDEGQSTTNQESGTTPEGDGSSDDQGSGATNTDSASNGSTDTSGGSTAGSSTTTPNTGPDELVNTGPGDEL